MRLPRVRFIGLKVQDLGFSFDYLEFEAWGFRVWSFRVWVLGFRDQGLGFGSRSRVYDFRV